MAGAYSSAYSAAYDGGGLQSGQTLAALKQLAEDLDWRWWEFHEWPGSDRPRHRRYDRPRRRPRPRRQRAA